MKFIIKDIEEGTFGSSNPITEDKLLRLDNPISVGDTITSFDIEYWNNAYNWGNHANAGYLKSLPVHTHSWTDITGKPSTFTPSAHTHAWTDITGKPSFAPINAEQNVQSDWNATTGDAFILNKPTIPTNNNQLTNGSGYITGLSWTQLTGKPSSYPPSVHSHEWYQITGKPSGYNPLPHSHEWSEINNKPGFFSGFYVELGNNPGSRGYIQNQGTILLSGGTNMSIDRVGNEFTFNATASSTVTNLNQIATRNYGDLQNKPSSFPPSSHTHTFASLTSKPTTIAGYGITNAVNKAGDTMTGNLTAPAFYETSLRKYKENIKPYTESGLDLINSLDIVSYDRLYTGTKDKVGIIADDTTPEFLNPEMDAVDLYKTIFIQAKAIQELNKKVDDQQDKIDKQEERLQRLEKLMSK
jgi:hypothetical protein